MAAGAGATAGLRFSGGSSGALAPHVIVGHADLASAGVRSLLLLREALRRWAGPERTASVAGELWAISGEGDSTDSAAAPCPRAWECSGEGPCQLASGAAALQVDTFHDADGKPVVSLVCINAQVPVLAANAVALDFLRKIIADKVNLPRALCSPAVPGRLVLIPKT